MLLSKDQILNANDYEYEDIEVKEWGGTVRVRTMSGTERDNFEASVFESKGKDTKVNFKNFRAKLCAMTIVNEENMRMFTDSEVDDLGKKSAKALDKVFNVAQKLNGIGAKEVEELTKN